MSVANGEDDEPDFFEAAPAEIGDVPPEAAVPDLVGGRCTS